MSLSRSCSFPPSVESRGVRPLWASARGEAFGVLCELRIDVYLDMLVRESLWDGEHGSNSL